MAFIKLNIRPGINKDQTNYTNEGGWVDSDKIRFRAGLPQKIGGWQRVSSNLFKGTCREMFRWVTSFSESLLALGTNNKLYIERAGVFHDVTPLRSARTTSDTDNCITLTEGSTDILVTLSGHGAEAADYLRISGVAEDPGGTGALFGIPLSEINTEHRVKATPSINELIVEVQTPASLGGPPTASGLGGTSIDIDFDIHAGRERTLPGYGWGTMGWSRGGWSTASQSVTMLMQQDWWFDRFYDDLIANIRLGPIYIWERGSSPQPDTALGTRAVLLSTLSGANHVPAEAMQVMVSQDDGHLIAFGCTPYGQGSGIDPLLIRWASQDEPTQWEPMAAINSSGFLRVSRGRRIMRALSTRQEILVWTESSLNALQYLGTTDVFGLQTYAENISIISPRAVTNAKDVVYWMGRGQFYVYTGRVEPLPCTMQEHVFSDINYTQVDQIFSASNEAHHEVWWFYPSAQSPRVDKYVVFNYVEQVWYGGNLARTAWIDSPEITVPQAVGYEHLLFNHETGADADGVALPAHITSADISLEAGDKAVLMHRMIPDFSFRGSDAQNPVANLSVLPRNFPGLDHDPDPFDNADVTSVGVDRFTGQVFIRARARHLALKIASEDLGNKWQLGIIRVDVRMSGRR